MSKASDIITIALAEVGYKEKATNANLDDRTANAGHNNWTKFARDLYQAGYYNGNKNGYAWCDVFVDWCFFKAYGKAEGQRIQCQTGPYGAGCTFSAQYFKAKGRYDGTPKVGDQIFFQSGGEISHTGIVVEVTGSTVVTVEGNSGDQVRKNTYNRGSSYIAGYGHPLYSETDGADVTPDPETPSAPAQPAASFKKGDLVKITGTKYYSGKTIPKWVKAKNWYVLQADGARVVIDRSEDGRNAICSPVNAADLHLVNAKPGRTVDELAREVIRGLWGNGADRRNRLTVAGYSYSAVQTRVNEILRG